MKKLSSIRFKINLLNERLLNPSQSGCQSPNSCVNQLLAVTLENFETLDCNPSLEIRLGFPDTSKAFDKVWHKGLLYKIKFMGISDELYELIENCLSQRFQRVILN